MLNFSIFLFSAFVNSLFVRALFKFRLVFHDELFPLFIRVSVYVYFLFAFLSSALKFTIFGVNDTLKTPGEISL